MNLEMRSAKPADMGFAWTLFSEFAFSNMFSGAPGRRPAADWVEDREYKEFSDYWAAGEHYLLTIDEAPIGWAALKERENKVILENWHLVPRWRNRGVTKTILGELLPQWKAKGVQVEASLLQDPSSLSYFEGVLTKLDFMVDRLEDPYKILRSSDGDKNAG